MKNYLKLQAKKSLSLLLAVLMLMSCWVWVAPTEAEAADGQYYVKYYVSNISEAGNSGNWAGNTMTINYTKQDGTTGSTTVNLTKNNYTSTGTNKLIWEGYVNGFPTSMGWYMKMEFKSANSVYLNVRGAYYLVGKDSSSCTHSVTARTNEGGADCFKWQNNAVGQGTKEATFTIYANASLPYINSADAVSDTTATIPKLGTGSTEKTTAWSPTYWDQYGVKWIASTNHSFYIAENNTSTSALAGTDDTANGFYVNKSGTSGQAVITEQMQVNFLGGGSTTKDYYLVASVDGGSDGNTAVITRQKITVTYPQYTVAVNSNGDSMDMSDGSTRATWSASNVYGQSVSPFPKGGRDSENNFIGATKAGNTFKGFWTEPQPTSGDAAASADEAVFATPVSSTEFANLGGTTGVGTILEKDGKKYYNAGKEWNSATDKEVKGDATYYGWWVSKNITVKFYDIDGSYLGTKTTKYGSKPAEDWYPDPKDGYTAGAYDYQGFAKQWRDITGAVITEGSYTFGDLDSLTLTPVYASKEYKDVYDITFINPIGTTNVNEEYDYRHVLSGSEIPSYGIPNAIAYDYGYSYEFAGWSTQVPANGKYHLVAKNDTSFTENTDWVVREDATYYAVYRSTVKEYVIAFRYTDTTGTEKTDIKYIPYGSAITTPSDVNRTYATGGYGYTLEGWDYVNNSNATVMFGVDNSLVFNAENVSLAAENLKGATPEKPIVFKAHYDEGKPTPYTVTFKYKDAKGNDKTVTDQVYHGTNITQETVSKLDAVPVQYDDGEALYSFANRWIVTEGTADKAEYEKAEFTSFSPTSHVTFEAVYGEGTPFYTVTYHANNLVYTERILQGANVPAWMIQTGTDEATGEAIMEEYVPKDIESETGTYEFAGWFDAQQADKDCAATNGTQYTTADTVEGNLDLYAQYIFEPFKFSIKFVNFDRTVLAETEVEAGQSFEETYELALTKANRAADETYYYTFIGWDNPVGNFLCTGEDMTFTAQYKPSYIYYKAWWYKDYASMDGADHELEVVGEDGLLAITNHTYKGKVYAPSVDLEAPEGKAFDGWKYLKDGVEADYVRGMTITDGMSFYATYKDAEKIYTVTAVVDGVGTPYTVAEGKTAEVIGTPLDGYVDETYHNKFEGWVDEDGNPFDLDTKITADITITATFTVTEHTKDQKELVSVPTYYTKGSEKVWCACNKDETLVTNEIPMLTDTAAPTGTIYLGTQGKWSSTDAVGGAADTNKYYANDDTDVILTINDTGDVNNAYNPSGTGKGIRMIRAFVSEDTFTSGQQGIAAQLALTIFTDGSTDQNNFANYVFKVGDLVTADLAEDGSVQYDEDGDVKTKDLVDGKDYIIYYYAVDKANNVLNTNVRTAKFRYDATAPDLEVKGDNNAATATTSTITYCGKATVTNVEVGATLTVNGAEVALTTTSAAGIGSYEIREAGNYIIKVTDKAGNSTSKKIIVTAGHDEVETSQAVTCTADGYEKITCAVCGKVIKNETIKSEGHQYGENKTVAPTCTEKGYDVKICSVCGDEVKTNETPAAGHKHEKTEAWTEIADSTELEYVLGEDGEKITKTEGEGEEAKTLYKIYELVYEVVTPATCSVKGKQISNCEVCGHDTITAEIPLDKENGHLYGGTKILKATCSETGEKYKTCKYCFEKETVEILPALNHVDTGRYTKVTTEATCYSKGEEKTYCKACDTVVSTSEIDEIAHTLVLVTYNTDADKSDAYPYGYTQYECKATGCTHTEGKTAIDPNAGKEEYSVIFKGAGEDGADLTIKKLDGESIAKAEVSEPEKAQDDTYTYTFIGWKAASTGKVVKLPVSVTKNETYTAEFKATKRIYTHQFVIRAEDATVARTTEYVEFANIIGSFNDENKKPVAEPTKAATELVTYEFAGWLKVGDETYEDENGIDQYNYVSDFTMTGDATFVAHFKSIPVKFSVLFYDADKTTVIWNTEVNGGTNAQYAYTEKVVEGEGEDKVEVEKLVTPVKDADADNHYTFAGWKYGNTTVALGESFGPIKETTRVYATYTETAHDFDVVEGDDKTWSATCTKAGQTTEECETCGYDKVTSIPVIDHNYVLQSDGSKKCSMCGNVIAPEAKLISVTLNESVTYGEATMPTVTEIATFDEIEEKSEFTYTAPEKAKTAEYEFTFVCWVDAEGALVSETAELKADLGSENVTYTAVYTAAVRLYNVTYLNAENEVIRTVKIAYNGTVPAAPTAPAKTSTVNDHFTFDKWSVDAGTTVTTDILIRPLYVREAHDYKETAESTGATCTTPGGTTLVCAGCGETITSGDTPALGHKYVEIERVEAEIGKAGYIKYECKNANCPEKNKTETIPALVAKKLTVIVLDGGAVVPEARVEIFKGTESVFVSKTNASGIVEFKNANGEYTVLVAGGATKTVTVTDDVTVTIDISEDNSSEPEQPGTQAPSCSCSCHRAGFWGMVFRFFHKVISWITGRINCCSCPDPEYY